MYPVGEELSDSCEVVAKRTRHLKFIIEIMVTPLGDYLAPPLIGRFFGS